MSSQVVRPVVPKSREIRCLCLLLLPINQVGFLHYLALHLHTFTTSPLHILFAHTLLQTWLESNYAMTARRSW